MDQRDDIPFDISMEDYLNTRIAVLHNGQNYSGLSVKKFISLAVWITPYIESDLDSMIVDNDRRSSAPIEE